MSALGVLTGTILAEIPMGPQRRGALTLRPGAFGAQVGWRRRPGARQGTASRPQSSPSLAAAAARDPETPAAAPVDTAAVPALELVITLDPTASVRRMTVADLPVAAALQEAALPGSFFVRLGQRYFRRYLATFVEGPHGIALVAVEDGAVAGMLVGTTANRSHYAWVLRERGRALLIAGLAGMMAHPPAAVLFLRTRVGRYLRGLARLRTRPSRSPGPGTVSGPDVAVLTHLAVAEASRGLGLGGVLVEAFTRSAREAGAQRVELVTASAGTGAAGPFYERLGWTFEGERPAHDGLPVRRYALDLRGGRSA